MATNMKSPTGHGFLPHHTPPLLQSSRAISEDEVLAILRPLKNPELPILPTETGREPCT